MRMQGYVGGFGIGIYRQPLLVSGKISIFSSPIRS
jgi:hypothetical protein